MSIHIHRLPPTHVIISLKEVEDFGYDIALILAILNHCKSDITPEYIKNILHFIPPDHIDYFIRCMENDGLIKIQGEKNE